MQMEKTGVMGMGLFLLALAGISCGSSSKDWLCRCTDTTDPTNVNEILITNQSKKHAEAICKELESGTTVYLDISGFPSGCPANSCRCELKKLK